MVFALGGASTLGALRAVEKVQGEDQYIGVIGDKAEFNRENYVLESLMYDTRAIFRQAVRDVRSGSFAEHPYELTLKNRGLWLLETGRTPSDAYAAGIEAARRIGRGRLSVPVTTTKEAVEALIAGQGS
jgi:basic membrane lipoprotein Med (substrate-binding protein (PBP1-ABC) superfamily)